VEHGAMMTIVKWLVALMLGILAALIGGFVYEYLQGK
jgi:hypothetical protein